MTKGQPLNSSEENESAWPSLLQSSIMDAKLRWKKGGATNQHFKEIWFSIGKNSAEVIDIKSVRFVSLFSWASSQKSHTNHSILDERVKPFGDECIG